MKLRRSAGFIWFFCLFSVQALGQEARPLDLSTFLSKAAQNDSVFQEILVRELGLRYQRALGLPTADWVTTLMADYAYDPGWSTSLSLDKLFPASGTSAEAGFSRIEGGTLAGSEFHLRVSQAIARNAFGRAVRWDRDLIDLEVSLARHQIVEAYEDYLASLNSLFLRWYSAHESLKTAVSSLKETKKLLKNIQARQGQNIALPVDVNKIRLQVLSREEGLIQRREEEQRFQNLIRQAIRAEQKEIMVPQWDDPRPGLVEDFDKSWQDLSSQNRTLAILQNLKDQTSLELRRRAHDLLPSAQLYIDWSQAGTKDNPFAGDDEWTGGLSVQVPWGWKKEKARHAISKIKARRTELDSEGRRLSLVTDLRNLHGEIRKEDTLVKLTENRLEVAREVLKDETSNYSMGRISLNDFIRSVNSVEDARFNAIRHRVQRELLIVEWLRLSDSLVNDLRDIS